MVSPLHDAIQNRCSPEVIYSILQHYKDSAKERSAQNNFPIYEAISYNMPRGTPLSREHDVRFLQVVRHLIQAYPEALKTPVSVKYGENLQYSLRDQLPIYIFLKRGVCLEVIQEFITAYPSALTQYAEDFDENHSDWGDTDLSDVDPHTLRAVFLPLHVALLYRVDTNIVKLLLSTAPETIRMLTRPCGDTALHMAIRGGNGVKNPDVVYLLIHQWVHACFISNDDNLKPIDIEMKEMDGVLSRSARNPEILLLLMRLYLNRDEEATIGDFIHDANTHDLLEKLYLLKQTEHTKLVIQLLEEIRVHENIITTQKPYASVEKLCHFFRNYTSYNRFGCIHYGKIPKSLKLI